MIRMFDKKHYLPVIAMALLGSLSLSACSMDTTEGSAETDVASEDDLPSAAAKVYEEALIGGGQLAVFSYKGNTGVRVTLPAEISPELAERAAAAKEESSLEGLYAAWTGGEPLPDTLIELAAAEKEAAENNTVSIGDESQTNEPEGGASEELEALEALDAPASEMTSTSKSGVRTVRQAVLDSSINWTTDATNFVNANCATNAKQYGKFVQTNYASASFWVTGRYQKFTGLAASYEGGTVFTFYIDDVIFNTTTVASRGSISWNWTTNQAWHKLTMGGQGLGAHPRFHQCAIYGAEKVTSVTVTPYQTPNIDVKVKGIDFLPSAAVDVYYQHPTMGNIYITSGTAQADGTFSFATGSSYRCEYLHMTKNSSFNPQRIVAIGSDGRAPSMTTNALQSACWPFLPN